MTEERTTLVSATDSSELPRSNDPPPVSHVVPSAMGGLRVERFGFVAELALRGPGRGNTLGPEFFHELTAAVEMCERDDVRVVVLRGENGTFCQGLDMVAMGPVLAPLVAGQPSSQTRRRLLALLESWQAAVSAIATCPKPFIAAASGACIGAGLDLFTACDVRLSTRTTRFGVRETKSPLLVDLGAIERLPSIIGDGRARELAFTGREIDGNKALDIGLVGSVFETEAQLLEAASVLAGEIAQSPPSVIANVKRAFSEQVEPNVERGLRTVALASAAFLSSKDLLDALAVFEQRRLPAIR